MLTEKQKDKFKYWLVNNLQFTSVSNVERIVDHVDRYFSPESPESKGNVSAEEQEECFNEIGGLGAGSATFKFYDHVMFQLRNKYTIIKKPF
jgi:hypothetical protein